MHSIVSGGLVVLFMSLSLSVLFLFFSIFPQAGNVENTTNFVGLFIFSISQLGLGPHILELCF